MAGSRSSRCTDPAGAVAAFLQEHVEAGARVCVGLSGGLDSVVLLDLLVRHRSRFGCYLSAVHVNHQLSPQAGEWARFCGALCDAAGVPLSTRLVEVADDGEGLEAAARRARYAAFAGLDADALALAHQRDDQAETVLLNLRRGGGILGAAAMPAERALGGDRHALRVLRPLLGVSREDIRAYALAHGLHWVEDESNADTRLARNFLRRDIVPLLERRFPGCNEALARSAELAAEAAGLLDDLARIDLGGEAAGSDGLSVAALRSLGPARAANLLRYWLRGLGVGVPAAARLAEILRQITESRADAAVAVRVGAHVVRRFRGRAVVTRFRLPEPGGPCRWAGQAVLPWGASTIRFTAASGAGIRADALARAEVVIRQRSGGEMLRLHPDRPRRSLKQLFQEAGIPPWERTGLPVLWCGPDVVWVPGVGIAASYRCGAGEMGWSVTWERDRR
jgi:tRNA(Ile)-lysidine synthase